MQAQGAGHADGVARVIVLKTGSVVVTGAIGFVVTVVVTTGFPVVTTRCGTRVVVDAVFS
jgi:hypothetical protein